MEGSRGPLPKVCPSRKRSTQEFQNFQNSVRAGRISRMSIYARGKLQNPQHADLHVTDVQVSGGVNF